MRIIDAVIGPGRAEDLEASAADAGHRAVRLADGERVVLRITCEAGDPDEFLESVRKALRENCETWEHYVVFEPLAVEPHDDDEEDERDESVAGTDELESFVAEGAKLTRTFVVLSVLSGVLASAGLLRGSTAVLVGAMVLAPLFKPIAQVGVGVLLGKSRLAAMAMMWLAVSLGLSSAAAFLVALVTPGASPTSLLVLKTSVSPFDLVVALTAGLAMAYVLVKRDSMAMVGIVVAASLMPVAAALGIAVALWNPPLIGGASFTLASNVGGVLLGLIIGLRVEEVRSADRKRATIGAWLTRRSLIAGTVLMLGLAGFSWWSYGVAEKSADAERDLPGAIDGRRVLGTLRATDGTRVLLVDDRSDSPPTNAPPEDASPENAPHSEPPMPEAPILIEAIRRTTDDG